MSVLSCCKNATSFSVNFFLAAIDDDSLSKDNIDAFFSLFNDFQENEMVAQ